MSAVESATKHFGLFIDGADTDPESTARIPTVDPTTQAEWATYANTGQADVARAVAFVRQGGPRRRVGEDVSDRPRPDHGASGRRSGRAQR